ncbi:helix-turn-helix transcriptional regulator [Flammeovirga sp. OC4]|uniref:helix-turn-helix transcriptional regulator n=1 Tax=Flammeovirga sp. OC4 TaxID=1382345 RepID=UPI0005C7511D|nr:AraC family transcriptional regulator [Flammeovirga sp. OC4]
MEEIRLRSSFYENIDGQHILFPESFLVTSPYIVYQNIDSFNIVHLKGNPTKNLRFIKESNTDGFFSFLYINSSFRFLPPSNNEEQYQHSEESWSYFSNCQEEEYLYFDADKTLELIVITFPSIHVFKNIHENEVLKNSFSEVREGYFLFKKMDATILPKLQYLLEDGDASDVFRKYSDLYLLIYDFVSILVERVQNKCIPKYYSSNDLDKTFRVKKYLEQNYASKSEPHDLEKVTGFGYSKLRKLFKEIFGVTILQYANDYKLQLAYQWLQEGKHNVSDCTYGLGFISVTHFGRMFKEKFGVQPSKVYKFG